MNRTAPGLLRFGKFNLVGLAGAAVQVLILAILRRYFRLPGAAAAALAVEVAVVHNFLWHQWFTFPDAGRTGFRVMLIRLLRFHAGNGLVSLAGNAALMYILVERLRLPLMPSALAAIGICAPVNFLLADRWVYARSGRASGRNNFSNSSRGVPFFVLSRPRRIM